MSHVTTGRSVFTDLDLLQKIATEHGATLERGITRVKLYGSSWVDCEAALHIPGWRYPIAIAGRTIKYDTYASQFGAMQRLAAIKEAYADAFVRKFAEKYGIRVDEEVTETGRRLCIDADSMQAVMTR